MRPLNVFRRLCGRRGSARGAVRHESGFILLLTLIVLVALTGLVAAVAQSSVNVGNTSSQLTLRDGALATADAGLHTALYRLNVTGSTAPGTGTLGNGTTYSYAIVSPLTNPLTDPNASACAGLWVQPSGQSQSVQQACITSTGTDGGLSVRTQYRVVGYTPGQPASQVSGLFTPDGFTAGQNFVANGDVRSNGTMRFGGGSTNVNGDIEYTAGNTPTGTGFCTGTCTLVQVPPLTLTPTVAETDAAYAAAATSNNDSAIPWAAGGMVYNAATATLSSTSNGNCTSKDPTTGACLITLPSGTYYFCNINLANANNTMFSASPLNGQPVLVYIDSPYRAGSACSSGPPADGYVTAKNNLMIVNPSGLSSDFQWYFYGEPGCTSTTPCPNDFSKNDMSFTSVQVYAPNSTLSTVNNLSLTGEFVIGTISTGNNAVFDYGGTGGGGGPNGNLTVYYPSAHQICLPPTTAGGTAGTC